MSKQTPHTSAEYMLFETALGVCGLAWTETGLVRVQLPYRDVSETSARLARLGARRAGGTLPPMVNEAAERMVSHARGETVDFLDLPLDFSLIPAFEGLVYRHLRQVPRGRTVTYGELAAMAGSPGAAQAVGTAMARNPWPVVVPCHRVLAAGNKPGGFSAPGGLATKTRLLAMEGVYLDDGAPMLPGLFS